MKGIKAIFSLLLIGAVAGTGYWGYHNYKEVKDLELQNTTLETSAAALNEDLTRQIQLSKELEKTIEKMEANINDLSDNEIDPDILLELVSGGLLDLDNESGAHVNNEPIILSDKINIGIEIDLNVISTELDEVTNWNYNIHNYKFNINGIEIEHNSTLRITQFEDGRYRIEAPLSENGYFKNTNIISQAFDNTTTLFVTSSNELLNFTKKVYMYHKVFNEELNKLYTFDTDFNITFTNNV